MAAQDLKTAELLMIGRGLQAQAQVLGAYPLTAAFSGAIDAGVLELIAVQDAQPVPTGRGAALRAADQEVDRPLSLYSRAIDWLAEAFPAEQDLWDRARLKVLPKGLRAVVLSSYPNEVGEMQRLEVRLAEDAALRADLAGIRLHTRTALDLVQDAIAGGKALEILLNSPDAPPAEETESERQVKGRFIQLIASLRSTSRSAKWTQEHTDAVFGPIDRAIAEATKRADGERAARLAAAEKKKIHGTPAVG